MNFTSKYSVNKMDIVNYRNHRIVLYKEEYMFLKIIFFLSNVQGDQCVL